MPDTIYHEYRVHVYRYAAESWGWWITRADNRKMPKCEGMAKSQAEASNAGNAARERLEETP